MLRRLTPMKMSNTMPKIATLRANYFKFNQASL